MVVTQRAGHAFDVMTSTTNEELNSYDGAVAVVSDWIPACHDVICIFPLPRVVQLNVPHHM